ncbi:MAG: hypothetical protein KAR15_00340 [Desulfobacterales bacterium]|nr:hypothetical protein [Desulfobacterales bacterium]
MKFAECKPGRIFAICLENGDIVHQEIEQFARDQSIEAASLIIIGGADKGSKLNFDGFSSPPGNIFSHTNQFVDKYRE